MADPRLGYDGSVDIYFDRTKPTGHEVDERGPLYEECDPVEVADELESEARHLRAVNATLERKVVIADATLKRERDGLRDVLESEIQWLEFDGCLTGDCPHSHANECLGAIGAGLQETARRVRALLGAVTIEDAVDSYVRSGGPEEARSELIEWLGRRYGRGQTWPTLHEAIGALSKPTSVVAPKQFMTDRES